MTKKGFQGVRNVTCSRCGEIFVVVLPDIDEGVKKVKTYVQLPFSFYFVGTKTTISCPECGHQQ